MILVIDNYDSFTFNLVQALQAAGRGRPRRPQRRDRHRRGVEALADDPAADLRGHRHLARARATRTTPASRSATIQVAADREIPLLGVCLGMQSMAAAFGASIVRAPTLVHGEASEVTHDGAGLLEGMPPSFMAARYHSLAVDPATLPPELRVTAMSEVDRVIMGIRHVVAAARGRPVPPRERADAAGPAPARQLPAPGRGRARRPGSTTRPGSFATAGLAEPVGGRRPMSDTGPRRARHDRRRRHAVDSTRPRLAMGAVMDGEATPAQLAALLMGLRMRGETVDELAGFATAMRERVVRVDAPEGAIDVVGTGGDGSGTFNISTTAALVAAAAGVPGRQARQPGDHLAGRVGRRARCARRPDRPRRGVRRRRAARPRLRLPVRRRTSIRRCATPARPDARSASGPRSTCSARSPTRPARAGSCWRRRRGRRGPDRRGRPAASARSGRSSSTATASTSCRSTAAASSTSSPTAPSSARHRCRRRSGFKRGRDRASWPAATPDENARLTEAILAASRASRRDVVLLNAGAALLVAGVVEHDRGGHRACGADHRRRPRGRAARGACAPSVGRPTAGAAGDRRRPVTRRRPPERDRRRDRPRRRREPPDILAEVADDASRSRADRWIDAAPGVARRPRPIVERLAAPGPAPHRRDQALVAVGRPDRRPPARTSSPGRAPTRPAAPRPSRSCASRTGSAARSTTCARSGPRSPSRCWPRSSSSMRASCRCCGPPAPTSCCCWPSSIRRKRSRASSSAALDLGLEPLVEVARRARARAGARDRRAAHRHQQPRPADARRRLERAVAAARARPGRPARHRGVGRPRAGDRRRAGGRSASMARSSARRSCARPTRPPPSASFVAAGRRAGRSGQRRPPAVREDLRRHRLGGRPRRGRGRGRRDRAQRRRRGRRGRWRSTRPPPWPAIARAAGAGVDGRASSPITADATPPSSRARSWPPSTRTRPAQRHGVHRRGSCAVGATDLEGPPPAAGRPDDVAAAAADLVSRGHALPRRRGRSDPARHRRRAAPGRHRGCAPRSASRRGGRPRAAGHAGRRPRARRTSPARCARSRPSAWTSRRAWSDRGTPGERPTKDPLRVALFVKRARAARDDRPNVPFGPTPVHAGLLEADGAGRWGMERDFGGRYVPETLMAALEQLETAYDALRQDPVFWAELRELLGTFAGRPTRALPRRPAGGGGPGRGRAPRGRPRVGPRDPARCASTSSARTSPTPAPTRSTTRSARRC